MPLPIPKLDDLRFQEDLVDEARKRIQRYCPEWTDYNVSDPGITLIELFAWMTELMVYRMNRVPERMYVKFLEMLGEQPEPATSAEVELTFRLSAPFPLASGDKTETEIAAGTEVATWATDAASEVIFTTREKLVLSPPKLVEVRRGAEPNNNLWLVREARLKKDEFAAFDEQRPRKDDAFYLGFDAGHDIRGYILRLDFEVSGAAQGLGINPDNPPLVWEYCHRDSVHWKALSLSVKSGEEDTTWGFNRAKGKLVLYLPLDVSPVKLYGQNAYWIRCRLEPQKGRIYDASPMISRIEAFVLGATTVAVHAQKVEHESLGRSDGEPGQVYRLSQSPVLALAEGETIQVQETLNDKLDWVSWEQVDHFGHSDRYDRHFVIDYATGEVRFGPNVIQADGKTRQYGRVPPTESRIRMCAYRHGGGTRGNVPAHKVEVLRSAISYVDRVTNEQKAENGRDPEVLQEVMLRAQRNMHAQERAVSVADFEALIRRKQALSDKLARVHCLPARQLVPKNTPDQVAPGVVELLIVPSVQDRVQVSDLEWPKEALERNLAILHGADLALGRYKQLELTQPFDPNEPFGPQNTLKGRLLEHLEPYRVMTTTIRVREPRYLGIEVVIRVGCRQSFSPTSVIEQVAELLRLYLAPFKLSNGDKDLLSLLGDVWVGWPFGRDLYASALSSLIQQVPGVEYVEAVKLEQPRPLDLGQAPTLNAGSMPDEDARASSLQVIAVAADTLLCLYRAKIEVVER